MEEGLKVINLIEAIKLYEKSMQSDKKAQNTIIKYSATLNNFLDYVENHVEDEKKIDIKNINEKVLKGLIHKYLIDVNEYKNNLDKTIEYKTSSSNNRRSCLRSFVKKMYVLDMISEDFSSSIEILKMETGGKKRVLSQEEIGKITKLLDNEIKEAKKEQKYLKTRNKYMFWFFILTGVRISELTNIREDDIDMDHNEIKIRMSKGKKTRIIDMVPTLKDVLDKYKYDISKMKRNGYKTIDSPYLFTKYAKPDKPMNPKTAYIIITDMMKKVGINIEETDKVKGENISPHNLRHTFASYGIDKNVNPAYLARQLGHASPDVLYRIYTHEIDQKQKKLEREKMGDAFTFIKESLYSTTE